uniref:Caffeoyl-CoA O-methyltransferase n=1 Tax=Oryza barthii TaxID=65489 RepID=A0A0D3GWF9_9ORYZ
MWGLVDAKLIRVSTAMHRFASASSLPPAAGAGDGGGRGGAGCGSQVRLRRHHSCPPSASPDRLHLPMAPPTPLLLLLLLLVGGGCGCYGGGGGGGAAGAEAAGRDDAALRVLKELREETAAMRGSQMQVSPAQAQLLAMLAQILGAQRCIEVGVYTGYSSLAVALALPESGRLVACERDERCLEVAKKYYQRAGVAHKVDVKHALAADSLKLLIDGDKRMYEEYYELLLKLVRVGGLIVIDNVLWYGRVADPLVNDRKTISIRNFNKKLLEDNRVSISMVPIGDGMTICRKLVDT